MVLMCLESEVSSRRSHVQLIVHSRGPYERKSTICAPINLWLIDVDEDSWVAQWPSASITRDNPCVRPSHRLFVNEFNCGFRLGLH